MTLIDQHAAAAWHRDQLDSAQRARLVRALRRQKRAQERSRRCDTDVQRAIGASALITW